MYIPFWVLIIGTIVVYWIYNNSKTKGLFQQSNSVEGIEGNIEYLKERIFKLVHFDSPNFLDCQNAFDAMEVNYFRLKQRFIHIPEKVLEIARDWKRYVQTLLELKNARIMLDVDWSDNAWDNAEESMKEPSIIKEEIEKKFKELLGKDWQEIPPDYFKRRNTAKPDIKDKADFGIGAGWKLYYKGEYNFIRMEESRQKEEEKRGKKK